MSHAPDRRPECGSPAPNQLLTHAPKIDTETHCPVCTEPWRIVSKSTKVKTCGCSTILVWEDRKFGDLKPITDHRLAEFVRAVHDCEADMKPDPNFAREYQRESRIYEIVDEMEQLLWDGMTALDLIGDGKINDAFAEHAAPEDPNDGPGDHSVCH